MMIVYKALLASEAFFDSKEFINCEFYLAFR